MFKAYWVVTYRGAPDPAKHKAYGKLAAPAIKARGGRFLVRGPAATAYEAGLLSRVVLIEFDSLQLAQACYDSPEYQAALVVFDGAAVRDLRIVEGET